MSAEKEYRYQAFISYAHANKNWARSIHVRLETFRTPKALVGRQGLRGPVQARLHPIFRDRDDLSTHHELGPALQDSLEQSRFLIVLCSPTSANSKWVNEEIRFFRKTHGDDRILAAIVDGDPGAPVGEGSDGCFPPALIEPPEGSTAPREPIAADFRKTADGPRLAFQKLASGMLGIPLDSLVRREAARRQRRIQQIAAGLAGLVIVLSGLTIYAFQQRAEAITQRAAAEHERDTVNASLDYLISIFEIANPATENPKTITALTILERGKNRIDTELAGKPEVQAKLMGAIGDVYANLGELEEAKRLLQTALGQPSTDIEDRVRTQLKLSALHIQAFETDAAEEIISTVEDDISKAKIDNIEFEDFSLIEGQVLVEKAKIAARNNDIPSAVALYEDAKSQVRNAKEDAQHELCLLYTSDAADE